MPSRPAVQPIARPTRHYGGAHHPVPRPDRLDLGRDTTGHVARVGRVIHVEVTRLSPDKTERLRSWLGEVQRC